MARILILDGYSNGREQLVGELAKEGNMVTTTGRPELIQETIESFAPDLVIMDLFLKGEVRWDSLTAIKRLIPEVPVLVYSSYFFRNDARSSLADGWIIKSYLFDELKRKINGILRRNNAPGGGGEKRPSVAHSL